MAGRKFIAFAVVVLAALACGTGARAQFRSEAFQQQYNNDDPKTTQDTVETMFSLKEYFAGLGHKQELKIGTMAAGSAVFVGGCQIYNEQYWKLPVIYGAIGGGVGAGLVLNAKGNSNAAAWCFAGAGVAYWAAMMDGVINYGPVDYPHAGKATLYSILLPGLGQAYNHEYWKIPVYLGLMGFGIHYYSDCNKNFNRFRNIYLEATDKETPYTGPISAERALYYKNVYRRQRDYALLAIAACYLLQVIDANVFSYMHDFEVTDDLSMRVSPTVIIPDNQFALSPSTGSPNAAFGLRMGFSF